MRPLVAQSPRPILGGCGEQLNFPLTGKTFILITFKFLSTEPGNSTPHRSITCKLLVILHLPNRDGNFIFFTSIIYRRTADPVHTRKGISNPELTCLAIERGIMGKGLIV